jgi:hypothetical protein
MENLLWVIVMIGSMLTMRAYFKGWNWEEV